MIAAHGVECYADVIRQNNTLGLIDAGKKCAAITNSRTHQDKDLVLNVNNLFTAVHAGFQVDVVTTFWFARVAVLNPVGVVEGMV